MNTPKRQVSFLERVPPDIWAYIAWYLPGEQLGRLMMTGATLLWKRLKSPGIVKYIKLGEDYLVFKSFPAFLRELPSLEELMIDFCKNDWIAELGISIGSLPSGLRKLEFRGNRYCKPSKLFGEPGATLMLSQHLPNLETLDLESFKIPDYSWMNRSPQSLTKLSLHRWDGENELPSCLIHFAAYEVVLSEDSVVSELPPRLESFVVSTEFYGVDRVLPLLPSTTLKLSLGGFICSLIPQSPQKLLEQLPKSLISLNARWNDPFNFDSYPDLIALLPLTLTELTTVLPFSGWPLLPQQLTTLSIATLGSNSFTVISTVIGNDRTQYQVDSVAFALLPRSITSLELLSPYGGMSFCGPPSMSNQSYFPPHLTHLSIPEIQLSPEVAKLLPASLTYLKVGALCERVCEHLPNALKTLISDRTLMSPNLIKFLPQSLTHLQPSLIQDHYAWFEYNTGKEVDPVSTIPEYTIHKDCTSNSFDWKDSCPLPPTLTYFAMDHAAELGDSFMQYQQLLNLLELHFYKSKHFTDLSIPLLPSNLTTLSLPSSSSVSGKSFPLLPKSLTYLNLFSSKSIFDSDIQNLPRTLKILTLHSAINLTDWCIPDLPPGLEQLDLYQNSQITPSAFPSFPYTLRSSGQEYAAKFWKWQIDRGGKISVSYKVAVFGKTVWYWISNLFQNPDPG